MKFYSFSRLTIIYIIFIAFLIPTKLFAASIPNGAKNLSKNNMFQTKDVNGKKFFCGKISKKFIPGKKVSGYFYSHQAEIKNLKADMKKTSNKKQKKKIKNKITKLKEFIAIRKDVCLSNGGNKGKALRFDFSGAVGLAISNNTKSNKALAANNVSSNLKKVDSLGNLKDAVVSGQAKISEYFVAPNNKLYILFENKININDTSNKDCSNGKCCLLAEIDKASGEVSCIDSTLDSIYWEYNTYEGFYGAKRPIQFDSSGAIYYLGYSAGSQVLRKYVNNGAITFSNLTSAKMNVDKFLVLNDGSVLVTGSNNADFYWLRKIPASGRGIIPLFNHINGNVGGSLNILSDGYLYLSNLQYNDIYYSVARLPQNFNSLDELQAWVGPVMATSKEDCSNYEFALDCYDYFYGSRGYNCNSSNVSYNYCGSWTPASYISPKGKVFSAFPGGGSDVIWQWYPKYKILNTLIKHIVSCNGAGENYIISGLDSSMREQITIYNTDTDEETQLLEPGKFSPYSFIYIPESNTVMFDALRYEDGEYVIGQINLDTHVVTTTKAGNIERLENFQALN